MINTEINGAVAHLIFDDGGLNIITPSILGKLLQTLQFLVRQQRTSLTSLSRAAIHFGQSLSATVTVEMFETSFRRSLP